VLLAIIAWDQMTEVKGKFENKKLSGYDYFSSKFTTVPRSHLLQ
jgi:hypothetical protein